jgi:hypothetical protein
MPSFGLRNNVFAAWQDGGLDFNMIAQLKNIQE